MADACRIPGPDHPISVKPFAGRIVVTVEGHRIVDSSNALVLQEASYLPVYYVPREDVDMTQLERTDHMTYCPYKGECSYFSIPMGGRRSANAVWSYENPFEAVASIRNYLSFYPERVDAFEVQPT